MVTDFIGWEMDLVALRHGLRERKALIVHFSHHQNMRDGGVFPEDLLAAIENKNDWPLSCSVMWPGHNMNPVGSVGVIFEPMATENVLSVCSADSGSSQLANGEDGSLGHPLSTATFEKTFSVKDGEYNEWRLRGATVTGIFVLNTKNIGIKREVSLDLPDGSGSIATITTLPIQFGEVAQFAKSLQLPVYTMGEGGPELVLP